MANVCSEAIEEKVLSGRRLSREEGLHLDPAKKRVERIGDRRGAQRSRRSPIGDGARHPDQGRRRIRHDPEARFTLAQRLLRSFPLGDVFTDK